MPVLIEASEKFRNKLEFFSGGGIGGGGGGIILPAGFMLTCGAVDASEADNAAAMAKVRHSPFAACALFTNATRTPSETSFLECLFLCAA